MKFYCEDCGIVEDFEHKVVTRTYEIKGQQITSDVSIKVCAICGQELSGDGLIDEELKIFRDKYRESNGLLTSAQIKKIRSQMKLTQREFAVLLGMGEKTITRYELGQIQEVAMDNLMRMGNTIEYINMVIEKRDIDITLKEKLKKYKSAVAKNNVEWKPIKMEGKSYGKYEAA